MPKKLLKVIYIASICMILMGTTVFAADLGDWILPRGFGKATHPTALTKNESYKDGYIRVSSVTKNRTIFARMKNKPSGASLVGAYKRVDRVSTTYNLPHGDILKGSKVYIEGYAPGGGAYRTTVRGSWGSN